MLHDDGRATHFSAIKQQATGSADYFGSRAGIEEDEEALHDLGLDTTTEPTHKPPRLQRGGREPYTSKARAFQGPPGYFAPHADGDVSFVLLRSRPLFREPPAEERCVPKAFFISAGGAGTTNLFNNTWLRLSLIVDPNFTAAAVILSTSRRARACLV